MVNGYTGRQKKSEKKGCHRFEASRPLELVQIDILEFFINKLKVYLLLLQDDYSRFIVGWRLASETSIDFVIRVVQESINRYGKMEEILSDRGFVFYSWRGGNRFESSSEAEDAIGKWINSYNYERTHQGLGGFLVPADRFQGRVDEVEQCIAEYLDPSALDSYNRDGISRSLMNVILESDGGLKLYLFGHPIITLGGVEPCQRN